MGLADEPTALSHSSATFSHIEGLLSECIVLFIAKDPRHDLYVHVGSNEGKTDLSSVNFIHFPEDN